MTSKNESGESRAGLIAFDSDQKYILVVFGKEHNKWGLPKGKKNDDETDIQCAIRETKEETGLDFTPIEISGNVLEHYRCKYFFSFPVDCMLPPQTNDPVEIGDTCWKTIDELNEISNKNGALTRVLRLYNEGKLLIPDLKQEPRPPKLSPHSLVRLWKNACDQAYQVPQKLTKKTMVSPKR